jgi:26S proteasome regulatory subunit N7
MLPFYQHVCEQLKWIPDQALVQELTANNTEKLKQLDEALKDATEHLGESEVRDAMQAKADFYCRIGDKVIMHIFMRHELICIAGKC